jgi:hypothetical protein
MLQQGRDFYYAALAEFRRKNSVLKKTKKKHFAGWEFSEQWLVDISSLYHFFNLTEAISKDIQEV